MEYGLTSRFDRQWIPYGGLSTLSVPAFGVLTAIGNFVLNGQGQWVLYGGASRAIGVDREYFINGPNDKPPGAFGSCTAAMERPSWALFDTTYAAAYNPPGLGETWGPAPGSFRLFRGLPGFTCLGTPATYGYADRGMFLRDQTSQVFWAKARANWADSTLPYVDCWAQDRWAGNVYDGSSAALPAISLRVFLPRNGAAGDPAVRSGDDVAYTIGSTPTGLSGGELFAAGSYLDDCVGTIKIWSASVASIPRGWALCDGTANGPIHGGSGIDLRGRFVVGVENRTVGIPSHSDIAYAAGASGGARTHSHAAHTTANATLSGAGVVVNDGLHSAQDHRPPWLTLAYIERID